MKPIYQRSIRNLDNRLVAKYYPDTCTLVIMIKGCTTSIHFLHNGEIEVKNSKAIKQLLTQLHYILTSPARDR